MESKHILSSRRSRPIGVVKGKIERRKEVVGGTW